MLKNYIKIAIAVLKRRKFFTFISLFGISITLTMLIVLGSFFDLMFGSGYPDVHRDRSLYINTIQLTSESAGARRARQPSFYFFDHYVSGLKGPFKLAISSVPRSTNLYSGNQKFRITAQYTNEQFWEVLEFGFLEGQAFNRQQVERGDRVAVLSEATRDKYFGKGQPATGKYLVADNISYRVTGVVKDVPAIMKHIHAGLYIPYTASRSDYRADRSLTGSFTGILLAESKEDLPRISEDYRQMMARIPLPAKGADNIAWDKLTSYADPYLTSYTRSVFGEGKDSGLGMFFTIISVLISIFLLLPTINLININISRIMERYSEIGVRKAFGASSKTLVVQFIVENILLTLLGGFIGTLLSVIVLAVLNSSGVIPYAQLGMNLWLLAGIVVTCIFFGFVSGVYPAWRMSRMDVVKALKAS